MKILSNLPAVPEWQVLQATAPEVSATSKTPVRLDLGNPLSVLPEHVQEQLRAGLRVEAKDIIRVPER